MWLIWCYFNENIKHMEGNLSLRMTKPTKWPVRPVKTRINLDIHPVWSESSPCAHWEAKDPRFIHVDSKYSDQTGQMPRLISSVGPQVILLVLSCGGSFHIMYANKNIWTASSEFGTYRLCEQRRFRRACAFAQSRQNLRCSLIQAVSQEEPSDRKPDPWPLWTAGHAQLKFVMTECSKTQIRLTGLI